MKVGVIGLGKLGLPVALTLESAGHDVFGVEMSQERRLAIVAGRVPEADYEPEVGELLAGSNLGLRTMEQLVDVVQPDVILVCVQTPHERDFEGDIPLQRAPRDFDYSHLRDAIGELAEVGTDALVVIVSTCLPGTFEQVIRPIKGELRVVYHPLFIAMGSVIKDYCNPEFVLVGRDEDAPPPRELWDLYRPLFHPPGELGYSSPEIRTMSITSAELTKTAYNAAIGFKIMLANTVGELADKVGANADDVMDTLKLATDRIVSTAYMTPGMGDGGGCHPRDQIALAWLADKEYLSYNPFVHIVQAREAHAQWLAALWAIEARKADLPMIMLGGAYKANCPLRTGSAAMLVAYYAGGYDNVRVEEGPLDEYPVACYFLATPHDHFLEAALPADSVLIDPWGVDAPITDVETIRPGRRT